MTHILKDSIGGNSKTLMITTVRSGKKYYSQTIKSLEYSANARSIQNVPFVNTHIDTGLNGGITNEAIDNMLQVYIFIIIFIK